MNIFYLDMSPRKAAQYHNDKHVVKMILESAQLLSTAHRVLDGKLSKMKTTTGRWKNYYNLHDPRNSILYSATHVNHPSAVWVRQNRKNYLWLFALFTELCTEYTYRYGKIHKCEGMREQLAEFPNNLPEGTFTEPTLAMPDDVKIENDAINSYRNYYIKHKTHLASWKKRDVPKWYSESNICQPTY